MSQRPTPSGPATVNDHVAALTDAITLALVAVNTTVTAHRADSCRYCTATGDRRACPTLDLATATLDMIIYCWRTRRSLQSDPPRDLHIAVQSGWLGNAESLALSEILDVLDLAATQVDAAGMNLPTLAGIGVAVIDGYRTARTGTAQ